MLGFGYFFVSFLMHYYLFHETLRDYRNKEELERVLKAMNYYAS